MAPTFENVVFDFDGTLADSAPGIERCLRQALAEVAPGEAPVFSADLIGPPVREMVGLLLPGVSDALIDDGVAAFRRCYDGGGWCDTVPYSGIEEVLRSLHTTRRRLFVVTNKPLVPTERILTDLGWDALFDAVVCRDSVTPPFVSKSAALGSLVARESLGASRTVFVGDTLDDASAAKAHGLAFVFAAYGYGDAALAERAWATISDPASLLAVLGGSEG